jgi:hypothetical protein
MDKDELEKCPYNYEVHIRELEKATSEAEKSYHQSRIDRCLDWKWRKDQKKIKTCIKGAFLHYL